MTNRLEGRRMLVTGAAAGIGRAIVERFMAEGAQVAALDRDCASLATWDDPSSTRPLVLQADVTDEEAIRAALPAMQQADHGTIVNISSGAELRPLAERTAYCASKAGLVMFSKALAIDLAPDEIRVNAICPGIIDTAMFSRSLGDVDRDAELARIFERFLIKRVGDPRDVANAALFLSCAESCHVTGSALAVDGGRTFH